MRSASIASFRKPADNISVVLLTRFEEETEDDELTNQCLSDDLATPRRFETVAILRWFAM